MARILDHPPQRGRNHRVLPYFHQDPIPRPVGGYGNEKARRPTQGSVPAGGVSKHVPQGQPTQHQVLDQLFYVHRNGPDHRGHAGTPQGERGAAAGSHRSRRSSKGGRIRRRKCQLVLQLLIQVLSLTIPLLFPLAITRRPRSRTEKSPQLHILAQQIPKR